LDAAALAIYSPAGIVLHTGDFKVDYTPVFGDAIDLQRFGEIGKKGVLALLCDSTNAERPGFTDSEKSVGKTLDNIFSEHKNTRIIIATFASNVDRVQQIINSADKFGRKVAIEGRSMVNIVSIASELGYISLPDNILIDVDQLKNYPDEKTVIITTGSQGESMAALSRMASGMHRKAKLFRNLRLCDQMLVFSMHRNRVQRIYQRINQLDIFLARMSADMYIFENHICTLAHQFIDHTGNRFLISRNRMGTEYNGIIWLNGN